MRFHLIIHFCLNPAQVGGAIRLTFSQAFSKDQKRDM